MTHKLYRRDDTGLIVDFSENGLVIDSDSFNWPGTEQFTAHGLNYTVSSWNKNCSLDDSARASRLFKCLLDASEWNEIICLDEKQSIINFILEKEFDKLL